MADVNPIVMGDESSAELLRRGLYKSRRYFHDCLPGCKPWSLKKTDHVPLDPDRFAQPTCRVLYQKSLTFFRAGIKHRERLFLAANRIGKDLRNGTKVATPAGWRAIERLAVGDEVIAADGTTTTVTGVYPQGIRPMLCLTFDAGETIQCSPDHRWMFQHPRARFPYRQSHGRREPNPFYGIWSIGHTRELQRFGQAPIPRLRFVVPRTRTWALSSRGPLPLDPYVVGVLIGDGCLQPRSVRLTSADQEIVDHISGRLPTDTVLKRCGGASRPYDYAIRGTIAGKNRVLTAVRALNLVGRSCGKRVPRTYLLNEPSVRWAVLQGLLDTDGSVSRSGTVEFSTTSEALAEDVAWLVASFGGKSVCRERTTAYVYRGERRTRTSFRVTIRVDACPFLLSRKADRWHAVAGQRRRLDRVLHRIDPTEPSASTCISVAHPSGLFVIEHGLVTHNTDTAAFEVRCHMTGDYPEWWEGRRLTKAPRIVAAGDTMLTTRDILQVAMLGPHEGVPTGKWEGMLDNHLIADITRKAGGVVNCVDTIYVDHSSGERSSMQFKSYDMGRRVFQGFEAEILWLDEEPPEKSEAAEGEAQGSSDIYTEALLRTMTTDGMIIATFTPLRGQTPFLVNYLETAVMHGPGGIDVSAKENFYPEILDAKGADAEA